MKVSVICTVLNEYGSLPELLSSLERQTRPPDEVVIADGGSADGTVSLLKGYRGPLPLRVLEVPGCTIAQGRNVAIRAATGEIIAATDAGVRLAPAWLEELVRPLERAPSATAVAGFFRSDPRSPFEAALGATVLPAEGDIRPGTFLPSSRSIAFTKKAWQQAGGYPEWLDYCEDLVFVLRLRAQGVGFHWAPRGLVYFRPRPNLGAFFLQYYRYARGDGKANLWLTRHLLRYGVYAFTGWALLRGVQTPVLWGLLALGGAAYLYDPYRRLLPCLHRFDLKGRLLALVSVPLIRLTGDVAKMLGYPVGVWWRWRHRAALPEAPNFRG